ncbi:TetR/AcrR family transcriptional regulator [Rhodococcus spongiicola]|uniref:TetR/AcrR family transcriptional regulator n=1 Tax=Rhodococcus spongiicola TaxID=2487352 RepID=A0A438B6U8_9NOCA|nr:TetR family transcriptional regulator [Rhodococcus spongiicola]RVW06659.1 TetR/AcrR family transcriptional regulator [Rhodococcus spongiicola]
MSPSPRTDSTRGRIVEAATAEFARHGVAGARIDRIAKSARTSKERVYAYFRSKEELYGFVAARELDAVAEATQMDPADLPGYAGRVHDYFVANPDNLRLMRWGQLEFADTGSDGAARDTVSRKAEKLRRAQREGLLDPSWDPLDILVFVNQLAMAWADQPGLTSVESGAREQFLADRRAAIVTAVERLFPAAPSSLFGNS